LQARANSASLSDVSASSGVRSSAIRAYSNRREPRRERDVAAEREQEDAAVAMRRETMG
jgi:hypothetical protein